MARSRKEKELAKKFTNYRRFQNSANGMEIARDTTIANCLDGRATEKEYLSLTENHYSYGPDGFKAVGPNMGPIYIKDSEKAKQAYARTI